MEYQASENLAKQGGCMGTRSYFVYIMTNATRTVLYTGVTKDLRKRAFQHKAGRGGFFSRRYRVNRLIYFESTDNIMAAIEREKQIKAGSRQQKIDLVGAFNPGWHDLYETLV